MTKQEAQQKVDELAEKISTLCEEYNAEIEGDDEGSVCVTIQFGDTFIQSVSSDLN